MATFKDRLIIARDKFRERFDIGDHPLWEELNEKNLNKNKTLNCSKTIFRKYLPNKENGKYTSQQYDNIGEKKLFKHWL